jgi:hypothetical protein
LKCFAKILIYFFINQFEKGIWRISANTKDEQIDIERKGSFGSHLFESLKLLIRILENCKDSSNLIEISRAFYQKIDQEKIEK